MPAVERRDSMKKVVLISHGNKSDEKKFGSLFKNG
jgi:hypothetical protein